MADLKNFASVIGKSEVWNFVRSLRKSLGKLRFNRPTTVAFFARRNGLSPPTTVCLRSQPWKSLGGPRASLTEVDCVDYEAKAHSIPIVRICRNRQRLPSSVLIENASDSLLDLRTLFCPRHFRSSLATILQQIRQVNT